MSRKILYLLTSILAIACKNKTNGDKIPPHTSFSIRSEYLNEKREISIWTPPSYDNDAESYKVLYLLDGGIDDDFPQIANTLGQLIEDGQIPPYILVGIENTDRARDLTGFSEAEFDTHCCPLTDGAKNFRAFISEELIPEIQSRFRTQKKRAIIGKSLGGLFVMESLFTAPEIFDFYIAVDPSLWWNNHFLVKKADSVLAHFTEKDIKFWFAGSNADGITEFTRSMDTSFQKYAPDNLRWKYSDEPNEIHTSIYRATKAKGLIWTLSE